MNTFVSIGTTYSKMTEFYIIGLRSWVAVYVVQDISTKRKILDFTAVKT
jgi:hypothetical protein